MISFPKKSLLAGAAPAPGGARAGNAARDADAALAQRTFRNAGAYDALLELSVLFPRGRSGRAEKAGREKRAFSHEKRARVDLIPRGSWWTKLSERVRRRDTRGVAVLKNTLRCGPRASLLGGHGALGSPGNNSKEILRNPFREQEPVLAFGDDVFFLGAGGGAALEGLEPRSWGAEFGAEFGAGERATMCDARAPLPVDPNKRGAAAGRPRFEKRVTYDCGEQVVRS